MSCGYFTWLFVKTRNTWSSASGANPRQSLLDEITPATNVPCPKPSSRVFSLVQLVLSLIFLKWGWDFASPVSNTATFTPRPVTPILHNTSACNIEVIWRGIARRSRRLVWRPVDCQNCDSYKSTHTFQKVTYTYLRPVESWILAELSSLFLWEVDSITTQPQAT